MNNIQPDNMVNNWPLRLGGTKIHIYPCTISGSWAGRSWTCPGDSRQINYLLDPIVLVESE